MDRRRATAPDLLELLQRLERRFKEDEMALYGFPVCHAELTQYPDLHTTWLTEISAAIAKARGEGIDQ